MWPVSHHDAPTRLLSSGSQVPLSGLSSPGGRAPASVASVLITVRRVHRSFSAMRGQRICRPRIFGRQRRAESPATL
ncbi:hypothetical protein PBY51_007441 [Eleginops maclovinus]|uniref:Uncharacterized protein n=1 Tax=Eleginops maclovinus TaxID=56733 RepID=A0AAN7X933_ELEMC|nr:hypothetical protein PBY51_007441 [Eleginops maclovinus]